jgi:hypothetical protein
MESQERDELEALFPGETYKLSNGEEIVIKPVTFGKLKVFIDAISSLFAKLESAGIQDIENAATWPAIFSVAHDEVVKIMMAITGKPRAWFDDELLPADGLHIFGMIVKQNITEDLKKKFRDLATVVRSAMPTSPSS